ncbi:MAG TPA: DUF4397 domain-containing protein [Gemmatimonadales bacterium]|nr:DUF4397 domain-containing protein [Gemmatimonadales bacterium]
MTLRAGLRLALFVGVAACNDSGGPPPPQASALRFLHTVLGGPTIRVSVDGGRGSTIAFGGLSQAFLLSPGQHDLDVTPADTTHALLVLFNSQGGINYTAFVLDTTIASTIYMLPGLVADSGAVPTGVGRLRLANLAALVGSIDAYRTQPDSTHLILTQQPFNYRSITPYFESAPGKWTVVISHGGIRDTLLMTDSIAVNDGQARTVAIIDSTGARVSWRVIAER